MPATLSTFTIRAGQTLPEEGTPGVAEVPLHTGEVVHPLLITGGMATGKTVLVQSIAAQASQQGREVALHAPIPAASLSSDVTVFAADTDLLDHLERAVSHRLGGDYVGPDLVLLDDAEYTLTEHPQRWATLLPRAFAVGVAVVAVTHTLHLNAFGQPRLRDLLLSGSVIRLWTQAAWDRTTERVVDLSALPRRGGAYLQTPAADVPVEIRLDYPTLP